MNRPVFTPYDAVPRSPYAYEFPPHLVAVFQRAAAVFGSADAGQQWALTPHPRWSRMPAFVALTRERAAEVQAELDRVVAGLLTDASPEAAPSRQAQWSDRQGHEGL